MTFPLAILCVLLGACGPFVARTAPAPPEPPAILLSVASRSVYLVVASTGGTREVAEHLSDFQGGYASWSWDHRRLAFGNNAIIVFDPHTNRSQVLVRGRSLSMPAWSPDGRSLVYGDGISLWRTPVSGPHPARIRLPAILAPLEMAWSSQDVIAFDGLALDCSQIVRCESTDSSEIWTILPDGTGLTQLTNLGRARKPKWSPDGLRLLFIREYPQTGQPSEAWTMQADGSDAHLLVGGSVLAADWSPDGSSLVVVRKGARAGTVQVWTGRADGSHLRPLGRSMPGTDATVDW